MNDREIKIETQGECSPGIVTGNFKVTKTIINHYNTSTRKRWKKLDKFFSPVVVDSEGQRQNYLGHLVVHLHRVFRESGYIRFVNLFCVGISEPTHLPGYYLISHQTKYVGAIKQSRKYILNPKIPLASRQEYQESINKDLRDLSAWSIEIKIFFTDDLSPLEFIYDPDAHKIKIATCSVVPSDPTEYPEKVRTTSELLTFIASLARSQIVTCQDWTCIESYYPLYKLYMYFMDNQSYNIDNIQVNVEDCEEWDYINTDFDVEVQKYL
jgi:hypothetical protein